MTEKNLLVPELYDGLLQGVVHLLEEARRTSARSVNTIMTAAYWQIGRRIVEREQEGRRRAGYGEALIERLAADLTARFGRGFSRRNLFQMREFYIAWPIVQTPPAQLEGIAKESARMQTSSAKLGARTVGGVKLGKDQTLPDESGAGTPRGGSANSCRDPEHAPRPPTPVHACPRRRAARAILPRRR